MQISDLSQIRNNYDHVYLSPHLDDAALSCGGAILRHRMDGKRVLVVTLCSAAPAPEGPFSDLAQEFHAQWALSPAEVVTARLREDALAMERIGADYYWAGMLDAIYRYPVAYNSRESLFGTPAAGDPLLPALRQFVRALRDHTPGATLYAPLGVGNHIDHQIACAVTLSSADGKIAFYEDFPYITGAGALDQCLASIGGQFTPYVLDITTTLARKIGAICAYASQLNALFGSEERMAHAVASYARHVQPDAGIYAERVWVRSVS